MIVGRRARKEMRELEAVAKRTLQRLLLDLT
jgi:hypothetical protein